MIKIETLKICEFRGIRDLTLNLNRKNFAVCGPNGTGKSGVVDALEFVLTGTISRLTGKGRGDLSIKEHAPHVDSRKKPENAYVEATVWIPALGKTVKAKRTVKSPNIVEIAPDSPEVQQVFRRLEEHPEIGLSRREIIRFVLTEPGQRAKDVQALLKLDELETLRQRFQKLANAADAVTKRANIERDNAKADFIRAMDIPDAVGADILAAANLRRQVIGLAPLGTLGIEGSIRDGLTTIEGDQNPRANKAAAKADGEAAQKAVRERDDPEYLNTVEAAKTSVAKVLADESLLNAVLRDNFLKTALDLYEGEVCPVCDSEKSPEEFMQIIAGKREKLVVVKALRNEAETAIAPLCAKLESEIALARSIYSHVKVLLQGSDLEILSEYGSRIKKQVEQLHALLPLADTAKTLDTLAIDKGMMALLSRLMTAVAALPEPSAQDAAKEFLITGQLKLEALRKANAAARTATDRSTKARKVFDVYKETADKALEKIYADVQDHFADLYRRINADDEGAFEAKLIPSMGKLGFGVDFYTRGFFPPGAYHSEGHQDSMGLCLYLALMKYLLAGGFTFAVLDDVLMSVDAGHRREVSKLLRTQFPDTQFVLTTHDKAWLKFMGTTNLVASKDVVHFRKWTVDEGPSSWAKGDVWAEIRHMAEHDEMPSAAGLLRRSLEHLSSEFCEALRAKVEFSIDGHHDLSDLLDPAINEMKSLLKTARLAAESWTDDERVAAIKTLEAQFSTAVADAKVEQWQINPSVHYNEWASLHKDEFLAVVSSFETMCTLFKCDSCKNLLEVSPAKGSKEFLRCLCGARNFSFMKKPATLKA